MPRVHRRLFTAWIAVVAITFAALAPSLAKGLGIERSVTFMELCTQQGMRLVAVDMQGQPDPTAPGAEHAHEHCPACLLPGPASAPLPVLPTWLTDSSLAHARPAAFLQASRTPHAWLAAQPRGPPLQA